jgi:hypothetical protein
MVRKLTIIILLTEVCLSSCTHYYYVANVQNVPLFKEKNEYRFSGSYAEGDESASVEVQAAYSVSGKIGIMANYMTAMGGDYSGKQDDWARGHYFDGAIGYYKSLSKSGVFEIYGGVGGSSQHHQYFSSGYYQSYSGTSDLSFIKLFLQPSLGFTYKIFDIAVSTRICQLSFNKLYNNIDRQVDQFNYDDLNTIAQKKYYLFLEPAITIRGGWKYTKVQFQASILSFSEQRNLPFEQAHLSLGLYIALAERYK